MRELLVGAFAFGFLILPATSQTTNRFRAQADPNKVPCGGAATPLGGHAAKDCPEVDESIKAESSPDYEHQRLRDQLATQAAELKVAREQLRQLQQRMEFLESQSRAMSNPLTAQNVLAPHLDAVSSTASQPSGAGQLEDSNTRFSGEVRDLTPNSEASPPSAASFPAVAPPKQEASSDSIRLAEGKVRIGTVLYADYAYYTKTGFGPQFISQVNQPGPGNNGYNTFEITRGYINLFYSPSDALTFRLTPDLYRQIGAAPATKIGKVTSIGPNTDQGLPFRLKYAYVDFNTLFGANEALRKDKLTIGQQPDPVIEWEEHLYGYRYVNLVPWDYLGFGAAPTGISLHGPIEFGGRQYLDFSIGVYNNASYKQIEQSEKKQAAARVTYYPLGARSDYDGLGFTTFYDFGYRNVTPDSGVNVPLYRVSETVHYTFRKNAYAIAGEFDAGRNSFTSSNFFSGSAPLDEFGLETTQFAGFDALVKALLNTNGAKQKGYVAFGHAQIPRSPFTLFGMYQAFLPNTKVARNPLDFDRIVAGISYRVSDRLRFALSSQNLIFTHSQFTFPATELQLLSPSLAGAYPNGIVHAVPSRIQAIFANTEFTF